MPTRSRATPVPLTQQERARSAKGLRSRLAILDATLVCIAKRGLANVTHRAVAAEAGVPHSLTTYFFRDLAELIEQAFERFVALASEDNLRVMALADQFLESLDPNRRHTPEGRQQVIDHLTDMLVEFVLREAAEHSVGIAVELNVLYTYRGEDRLRQLAQDYRAMLVRRIAELIRKVAPERAPHADVDASIVLAVLHTLELDCMNAATNLPRGRIRQEISRLFTVMFSLAGPDGASPR